MAVQTSAQILEACQGAASHADQLSCVVERLLQQDERDQKFANQISLVYSAALVFLMQAGFAMLCAGAVRKKNVQNTMLKNLLDACGAAIAYFCFGYAFAFGDGSNPNGFIGTTNFFLMDFEDYAFWMFQYAFSAACATIVAGTLAERCQMAAYLCYSLLLAGFVYPVVSHSIWSPYGFLSSAVTKPNPLFGSGVVDFAGGGVVHFTGGTSALFATMILGPRRGRFHDEEGRKLDKPKKFPGHSVALQMLGTIILWFGWYGFDAGSALITTSKEQDQLLSLCALNTTLSGGMAGLVSLFLNYFILERRTGEPIFDVVLAMNGTLGGLVAITAGCGVVEPWAAVVIGACAGVLYLWASHLLIKVRLDDAVDAIPVHMANGFWGLLAVGLLASPSKLELAFGEEKPHVGWFYSWARGSGDARLLAAQVVGILWIFGWVLGTMMPFFIWLDWKGWFRSDPLEEIVGLDTSYHGGLILLGGEESVNPEYILQFKKQRSNMRRRRASKMNRSIQSSLDEEEGNDSGDADALTEPENIATGGYATPIDK